jgi:hypothetical protein
MGESESARSVQAASLYFFASVAETIGRAGASTDWLNADRLGQAAREAVAEDPVQARGDADGVTVFVGMLNLELAGTGSCRISSGQDQASLRDGLSRALRRPWQLTDLARMSVDAFAERYARDRHLTHELTGTTPDGPWFLGSIYPKRSHSFMRGPLAGGPQGLLWYAEKVLSAGRGRLGADSTRFEVRAGILCVYTRGAQRTTQTLDAFCQRAARIAAQAQRITRPGPAPG